MSQYTSKLKYIFSRFPVGLFLALLLILFLKLRVYFENENKGKKFSLLNIRFLRESLSLKYFGHRAENCNDHCPSDSQGLLLDAAIVCDAVRHLPSRPVFYFEETDFLLFDNEFDKVVVNSGWIFVNLDMTDFSKIFDKTNPCQTILCKTKNTEEVLRREYPLNKKDIFYTGFTSVDKYDPNVTKNYRKFLHLAGKSPFKGTNSVFAAWIKNPTWPTLTVVVRNSVMKDLKIDTKKLPSNIIILHGFVSEEKLLELMNECGIHICPSIHEGFGHYLNEARSCKAVTVYTDAPCMNEFFINGVTGIGVKANQGDLIKNKLLYTQKIDLQDFQNKINLILTSNEKDLRLMGEKARKAYIEDNADFKASICKLLEKKSIPKNIHLVSLEDDFAKYEKQIESWVRLNPDFQIFFWNKDNILKLIDPNVVLTSEFARMVVVYNYGGLYVDLNFFCVNNVSDLIVCQSYFIYEPMQNSKVLTTKVFAAGKNDAFIGGWIKEMLDQNVGGNLAFTTYYTVSPCTAMIGNTCNFAKSLEPDYNIKMYGYSDTFKFA
jgi:glycosyltransferase involved in cell wall biosynthesis